MHNCSHSLSVCAPPLLVSVSRASCCPAMDIWCNQIWNNQSDQHILILTESIILTKIISPRELNQKKKWLSNHRTLNGPSRALHFLSAEETAYISPALPSVPSHFSRLTESLKGLHQPQSTLWLKWPFASLTCLPSCIWIQACQSFALPWP